MTLAIQFVRRDAQGSGEADDDPAWETCEPQIGIDYADYAAVAEAVRWLDFDSDGRFAHRIVELGPANDDTPDDTEPE